MKYIHLMLVVVIATLNTNAQSVFFEDFESGVEAQFTQQYIFGTLDWKNNSAGMSLGATPAVFEGDSTAHFYASGNTEDRTSLISPSLDLSAGGYKLSFAHAQGNWAGDQNTLAIHYSGDDGATWTLIDSITDNLPNYVEVEYNLDDYVTTTATSQIRFDGYSTWGYAIGLDVVNVFLPPAADAELVEAISPVNGCGLGNEIVAISVFNNGLDTIFSIDASYELNAVIESETFSVQIPSGQTDTLYFSVPVDMSSEGTYDFAAWVDLTGDAEQLNDSTTFSAQSIAVISGLPYVQDFENGNGGWVSGMLEVADSWELGLPINTIIDTANSGVNAWVTNLDGDYVVNEESYVESPCMDFSSLVVDPVFQFAFISDTEVNWDGTWIEVSTDAGLTWVTVGSVGEGTNWYNNENEHGPTTSEDWWDGTLGTSSNWLTAVHLLDGAAGSSSVKVRIRFSSDVSGVGEGFAFDDIEIYEQPSINAGVTEILSPTSGCGLLSESVTLVVENFGDADLVDFDIEYQVNNGSVVSQVITDTLYGGEIDTITLSNPILVLSSGNYDLGAWTVVTGDGELTNDSAFTSFFNSPVVNALPYAEDFESGDGGWTSGGTASSWELGEPQGTFIDTANSGINAWVTNLAGDYNVSENSYIESPCFDFSSLLIDPILEFAHIYETESCCDEGYVDISLDGGTTWSRLGGAGEGSNWYNDAANSWWDGTSGTATEWRTAMHLLDGAAGNSSVKIRFVISSDGSIQNDGFGVDDISITEQPAINSEITTLVAPLSACQLTNAEEVVVEITNLGSTVMDSVILGYSLNSGSAYVEVFDSVIQPTASATFTFTQTIDLSTPGDYDLTVWTGTIGDGDTSNDSVSVVVTSIPTISSIPYFEDFENGTGGWTAGGTGSSWEFGDANGTFIDTANSGVNAWVTNLTGPYNVSEDSYLESPCMDFSNLTDDPILGFAHIYETESCCDEGWVEVSTDGGSTYTKLGLSGEGENWYNDGANQWWDGTSGDATVWRNAEHILDGTAGQSDVKVRFILNADFSIQGEGFGVDDIRIYPQPQLDLVAISMSAPEDDCNLENEAVTMTFWNKGIQSVSGFDLGFSVDGYPAQTETYAGTVDQGDTVTYTFSVEMADLTIVGAHSIDVFTALAGDEDATSDTIFNNEVINFGGSTPISQTEEPEEAVISATIAEGTSSQLFFCGLPSSLDGCLEIESVSIDSMLHTWLSDVDMFLISPAGDSLELSTDNGGSGDNMINVVFTDTSSNDITLQTAGIAPGYYHPEDTSGFAGLYNGQNPNGSWILWIDDDLGGDDGQLFSWSITFKDNSPAPVLNYSDTTICLTHVLEVESDDEYDSYLWSTGNNTQSIELYGDILGLGTHDITLTVDLDGCSGTSNPFTITVDACAGISELSGLTIDVYPNPTTGNIVLDITGESNGFVIDILDMHGKSVYNQTIGNIASGVRKSIDLSNVANGMYFLRMDDGKSFTTTKLIKQ